MGWAVKHSILPGKLVSFLLFLPLGNSFFRTLMWNDVNGFRELANHFHVFFLQFIYSKHHQTCVGCVNSQSQIPWQAKLHVRGMLRCCPPRRRELGDASQFSFWQSGLCRRWIYLSRSTSTARTPEIGKARKKKRARGAAESEFQIEDVEAISGLWVYESMFLCGIERLRFCLIVLFRTGWNGNPSFRWFVPSLNFHGCVCVTGGFCHRLLWCDVVWLQNWPGRDPWQKARFAHAGTTWTPTSMRHAACPGLFMYGKYGKCSTFDRFAN